ncbi:MAG: FG-GAP repeat protein [Planctomycetes bacterium]|nr:FG-GAP repeat protein [Planctomycetota bacterium]MCC7173173.1 FG-GAP repeat protein [Planctomycetota bacterium]
MRRIRTLSWAWVVGSVLLPIARAGGDFNGDGFEDVAIGVPGEDATNIPATGLLHVYPGSANGPDVASSVVFDVKAFGDVALTAATLGSSIVWGDFDGDGFDDLAASAVGAPIAGLLDAGRVYVTYGSASGFDMTRARWFDQNTKGIKDKVEREEKGSTSSDEFFGFSLSSGDYDADGYDDLAIGVIGERIGKHKNSGAVHVIYGSAVGLRAKRNQLWHQNSKGVRDKCEEHEGFGGALTSGDLNADGFDDLVIAVGGEADATPGFGRAAILFGSKKRLRAKGNLLVKPESASHALAVNGSDAEVQLVVGDFNGDDVTDLVVSVPKEPVGVNGNQNGVVFVAAGPITAATPPVFTAFIEGDGIVPGTVDSFDNFGASLAVGDFDFDGFDDLAIGAPGETVTGEGSGRVTVLYGAAGGLATGGATTFDQNTANVDGVAEMGDQFGFSLAAVDTEGDGAPELFIGVPGENINGEADAGAVNMLLGVTMFGLITANDQLLYQDQPNTPDTSEAEDFFGFAIH